MTTQAITIEIGRTFGPLVISVKNAAGTAYDLTGGWTAEAEVRAHPSKSVLVDLNPSITSAAAGEVTIEVAYATTAALSEGQAYWDLMLISPAGKRFGGLIGGPVEIVKRTTQP